MFKEYGTKYGAKIIDIDLVESGSTIITCGVGEDISFPFMMERLRKCNNVGVDPTEKSLKFIQNQKMLPEFQMINKALWINNEPLKLHKNKNPQWVSESLLPSHNMASKETYLADCITVNELVGMYDNISVLTLDVEGAEYDIIENLQELNIPQVAVEFHHFCCKEKNIEDTKRCIDKMKSLGYGHWIHRSSNDDIMKEVTFVYG